MEGEGRQLLALVDLERAGSSSDGVAGRALGSLDWDQRWLVHVLHNVERLPILVRVDSLHQRHSLASLSRLYLPHWSEGGQGCG